MTYDDDLLLFDDGRNSLNQTPPGDDRTYSAPRKYHIDTQAMTATEVWNYPMNEAVYSPFCSSVYEDSPLNYLVDYSMIADILGLDAKGDKIFHYRFTPLGGCDPAWNAIPIHLENLLFTGPDPLTAPGGWHITSVFHNRNRILRSDFLPWAARLTTSNIRIP